ncbi:MAG: ABC transporter ATP-binding protein [Gammaproteobacteria bacterium]|nr:ABC transporter ATP-binding protein [Gammaproteobacteria bacterium]
MSTASPQPRPETAEPLLRIEGLKTHFDTPQGIVRAVDGVGFEIARGETFALLGESGCGKSVTALSLMRLVPEPAGRIIAGRVALGGTDLLELPEAAMRRIRGRRIGMIFQEPMTSLNPVLTVGRQITEGVSRHGGLRGRAARERAMELLDAVGIPDPRRRLGEYPHQLSGGMKQRVMIAIALAGEPELLIADEPTTALDVTIQAQILELLVRLQRELGMAMLLITHDLGVVGEVAHRVGVMYAGQIVETAPRKVFFSHPRHPYSRKLFESLPDMDKRDQRLAVIPGTVPALTQDFRWCRFAARCDLAWQTCREVEPRWLRQPDGGAVLCHLYDERYLDHAPPQGRPGISARTERARRAPSRDESRVVVEDLKVHFPIHKGLFKRVAGHVYAVDGVSLSLRPARTVALVGESGCGKTTVGKAMLQLIRPTAGHVRLDGTELTRLRGRALRRRRRDLQIVFQDPYASMNPRMMVGDIVEEGMLAQGIAKNAAERRARTAEVLEAVGLGGGIEDRYPHEFSGGQRQRICIARALAVEPKFIVCDEPTSALDVSVQAQILNLLQQLQEEMELSYLFITHDMAVVGYLAHDVAVMYLGRIVEHGTVDEVLNHPKHPYTQALLSAVPTVDAASGRQVIRLPGDLPSPVEPPAGCHFHPRCTHAMDICRRRYPDETQLSETRTTRCWLYEPHG